MTREEINVETWKFVHWQSFRQRTQFLTYIVKMWNSCPLAWRHNSPLGPKIGEKLQRLITRQEINVETWKFVHWPSFRRRTQFWTHIVKMWNSCPLAWRHKSRLGAKIGEKVQRLITRQEVNVETWKFVHWLSFRRRTQFWTHIVKMWNSCPLAWRHKSPLGPKIGEKVQRLITRQEINVETWKFVHWQSFRRRTRFWTHIVKMWNSRPLAWRYKSPLGSK